MTDLKTLADMLLRGQLPDNERAEVIGLLRAASTADCGMGWWKHTDPNGAKHNEEVQAARVAIALAKAEAAWLRAELLPAHAQAEEMSGKLAAMQDAIDAAVAEWDNVPVGGYINTGRIIDILRPHATPTPTLDASEYAKPPRQWISSPPADRSGKWWNAWSKSEGLTGCVLVGGRVAWETCMDPKLKGDHYDLWLPWQEGDTEATLPPLPKSPATVADSATVGSPKADDTRELIARLAEAVQDARAENMTSEHDGTLYDRIDAIIADARRGGGA